MALNVDYRGFKIISRVDGSPPLGINPTKLIVQHIHINAGFQLWQTRKDGNKYWLTIGPYPSTGVVDSGNIAVTINPRFGVPWEITHYRPQDAFTITLADGSKRGWTVNEDSGMVELHPIKATIPSNQLFVFESGGR